VTEVISPLVITTVLVPNVYVPVTPPPVELMVILPVEPEMEMPDPAVRLSTPVFDMATFPTVLDTLIPRPAMIPVMTPPDEFRVPLL
jgi:hypothetical protein